MPTVSVVIPTFNHAPYLRDAIGSALNQSFDDVEIIVVDDGSTDDTRSVVAEFSDPRMRYWHQDNAGLSATRNEGIRKSSGELIALLDADDMWLATYLETITGLLRDNPTAAAAYTGYQYVDSRGDVLGKTVSRAVAPNNFRKELLRQSWLCPSAVVVRAPIFRKVGNFDERLKACEDFDMWLRISMAHQFVGTPDVRVMYRRTGSNMSDDVGLMGQAMSVVLEKNLGPIATPVESWSETKRISVSQLFSMQAQGYLAQGNFGAAADSLTWLLRNYSEFAVSLDLWYSLACVHQLVGQRGEFESWNPSRAEEDLVGIISELATRGTSSILLAIIGGRSQHALGLLNYGKGRMLSSRRHLWRAIKISPRKVISRAWVLTVAKTYAGMYGAKFTRRHRPDRARELSRKRTSY